MMNKNFINVLFFMISSFLIFNNIPIPIQMNFIGGILGGKLVFYPIFFGIVYTLYCQYKYKNVLVNFDKFIKFFLIYFTITFISLIIGLYNYPYYDLLINGPVTQIEKLPKMIEILKSFGFEPDIKQLMISWMIARTIKSFLFQGLYTFGGAYMIYCWYHDDWRTALKILVQGVLASLIVVFAYTVIEVFFLAGNEMAKNILEVITPYFHFVKYEGTWWPPLLWYGQLRSLFAEPSYYGIYFASAMPLLWYAIFKVDRFINKILLYSAVIFFTFGLFLTQARTAVALFLGEIFLLVIAVLILRNKAIFFKFVTVLLCSMLAFGLSNVFISNYLPIKAADTVKIVNNQVGQKIESKKTQAKNSAKQKNVNNKPQAKEKIISHKILQSKDNQKTDEDILNKKQINAYLEKNLFSLTSLNKRSNNSRYSVMIADIKIGFDNPLFGVGTGLRNAYISEYLPEMSKNNGEIKRWLEIHKEKGIMRSTLPKLGEYTYRFAETGILGLTMFLILPLLLLKQLYFNFTNKKKDIREKLPYVFFTITFIGSMAAGIGSAIDTMYCYWVLLGLGYTMCFGKDNYNRVNKK